MTPVMFQAPDMVLVLLAPALALALMVLVLLALALAPALMVLVSAPDLYRPVKERKKRDQLSRLKAPGRMGAFNMDIYWDVLPGCTTFREVLIPGSLITFREV